MARPQKNNADYFSHDNGMRNDRKIKALRLKFGILGYGVWCMLLEHLTASENNEMTDEEIEMELIAGDFGVSVTEIKDILNYCEKLRLLVKQNNIYYSVSLKSRLSAVYAKRDKAKQLYQQKLERQEVLNNRNQDNDHVSVAETTQSKVNKSKVNNNSNSKELLCETSQPHVENINYENLIKFFNSETKGVFGNVKYPISESRTKSIRARIREHGKETFISVIKKACKSNFLKGDKGDFKMTFDWMIKPTNFEKILSGNYDNKQTAESNTKSQAQQTAQSLATEIAQRHGK